MEGNLMKSKNNGFTLIELIVVVVIIGLLTTIAVPIYKSQLTKARRSDGKMALLDLASRMERFYIQNQTFATATIGNNSNTDVLASDLSPEKNYKLSLLEQSATSFLLQATPQGIQAKHDEECGSFQLNQQGQKSITGRGSVKSCW